MITPRPENRKLILLPGLDGTGRLFAPLIRELPDSVTTVTLAYPPDTCLSFEEHVAFVSERLPRNEPFYLLAESFSGPVALAILKTGRYPVVKTLFVATFARAPRPKLLKTIQPLPLASLLKIPLPSGLIRYFCLGHSATDDEIAAFRDTLDRVNPKVLAARLAILAKVDLSADLSGISTPCSFIQATQDRLVPRNAVDVFREGLKNLDVVSVPGPHFILQAESKACAEVIATVLDSSFKCERL